MNYLLDTDTIIYFLKGNAEVINNLACKQPDRLNTSIINHAELMFGVFNSEKKQSNLKMIELFLSDITILPFCESASKLFAKEKAGVKTKGSMIADLDLMIASIAIKNNCTLVTNNTKHFSRFKQLKLDNWSIARTSTT